MIPRGEDDGRQVGHGLLQRRVRADGVLPYLVGVGRQVYVALRVAVQDACTLVVQVDDSLVVVFVLVLKERLVSADHLGVFPEALPYSPAQVDDALDALGGKEGVAEYLLCLLSDAVHAARALDEADDGPRQVVVHDYVGVLEVLAFA